MNASLFNQNIFVIAGSIFISVLCIAIQFFLKRTLDLRQYGYFRDIVLVGAWLVLASWFGSFEARVVVCGAMLACFAGVAESIYQDSGWLFFYPVIGALCAYFGPSVNFIRFPDGEYIYLDPKVSFIIGTIWFSFFPFIFRYLDEIPGLVGHVLAVTFVLMLAACIATGAGAFFMTFAGLVLIAAFWSRFGNLYRQSGRAMASMWGVIVAGTAFISNTKGIILSTVLFLSLGLFAIPIAEIFFNFVREIFTDSDVPEQNSGEKIYSHMLSDGVEPPEAVQSVAGLCALTSIAAAWEQWLVALIIITGFFIFRRRRKKKNNNQTHPTLWGVKFDNVSMNYAISKARGLISNPESETAQLIVTLNATGMELTVKDPEFYKIVKNSSMVLADGFGLCLGMKIMGSPVQERVAGIDFAEQLCRAASVEGWPVYFCGASGETSKEAAEILQRKFPGLIIAGARDGFFDINATSIPEEIAKSGAKILLAAMGQPRQEKWVYMQREILGNILCVGVGGAFDVLSGKLNRAHLWVQKIGFEWLYRMIQEPGRWKKNLPLISFVFRILASKIRIYRVKRENS